jgi:hypothetical protein
MRGAGSILGWVMLIAAAAGIAGCFLPFASDTTEANSIWARTSEMKFLYLVPVGFGLILLSSLFLALGTGSRKMWMTFIGLGTGCVGAVSFFLFEASGMSLRGFAYGFYFFGGAAALMVLLAIVEGLWPGE